jgi:hypothetical protein
MKTILLQFKSAHMSADDKPQKFTVEYESADGKTLSIAKTTKWSRTESMTDRYTIEKQEDGSWRSNTSCEYVQVKADRRPKPFSVESQEEGRGPKTIRKFATTEELKTYIAGRWQGWDYYDGDNSFHNDYATFVVKGANLADLVTPRDGDGLVKRCSELDREVAAENGYSQWEINNEMEG